MSHATVGGRAAAAAILARLTIVENERQRFALISGLLHCARPCVVSFLNQHALNLAWSKPEFARSLQSADVVLRDGVGVEICLRVLGRAPGMNMNGTDLIPQIAHAFAGRRVAFFGTAEPWTSRAVAALSAIGCKVVASMDGFQPIEDYLASMTRSPVDLLILGMGIPKQEHVAASLATMSTAPIVIVNGGAIGDFLAQRFARAPTWLRRAKLEWVFRLLNEPRRMFRRYVSGGFVFLWRIFLLYLYGPKIAPK